MDGVSLTVNQVDGCDFSINLIPHTVQVTTLRRLATGGKVRPGDRPDRPLLRAPAQHGPQRELAGIPATRRSPPIRPRPSSARADEAGTVLEGGVAASGKRA